MPNHITTKITSPDAGAIKALIELLRGTESDVDFNKVIPMPECFKTGNISSHVECLAKIALGLIDFNMTPASNPSEELRKGNYGLLTNGLERSNAITLLNERNMVNDLSDNDFETYVGMLRAYRKFKCLSWYDWSIQNWGTKWNVYDISIHGEESIMFQTAWSFPVPVAEAICNALPQYTFIFKWADEDVGANAGHIICTGTNVVGDRIENGSDRAYELAIELGVASSDTLKKIDGVWQFIDHIEIN